jgi:hypothetical protein
MGQTSRIVVAEACVQALDLPCTIGQTYEINSIEVRSQFVHLSLFDIVIIWDNEHFAENG